MNFFKTTLRASVLALSMVIAQSACAQKISQKSTSIVVSGTSTMHDWTMSSNSGAFSGNVSGNAITDVKFSVSANSLKSTKGKMMDNKAHDALKVSKNPTIYFAASSINIGKGTVNGKLAIAGVTKNVSFPVTVVKKGNAYVIEGTEGVKLSQYGMERPGFMGMKTGDDVTVKVTIVAE